MAHKIYGGPNDFGPCGTLGVFDKGNLIAGVVFHNWQDEYGVIEISAAADDARWLTKTVIRTIMAIVFDQHGCQQLATRQAVENERAVKNYRFLGFTEIILPNMRGTGQHELLMLLTADEWRGHKLNNQ